MQKLKILMIGPQASGKGTQALFLGQKFNIPIFSTGNILRQKKSEGDGLGNKIADLINNGILVPDEMVNEIIAEKIKKDGVTGYILDGYPRNMAQAEFLNGVELLTYVFEINISDETAVKRIAGRRTCPRCQRVYHIETNPPQADGECDECGEVLYIREDETEEIVRKRLETYHRATEPILEFYKNKGIYYRIAGEKPIEEVEKEIEGILDEKGVAKAADLIGAR